MIRNIYTIAGYTFIIESIYNAVHELCIEYQDKGARDFIIQIQQSDIDYERQRSEQSDLKEGIPVRNFSDSYLETLAVYRQLCEHLMQTVRENTCSGEFFLRWSIIECTFRPLPNIRC